MLHIEGNYNLQSLLFQINLYKTRKGGNLKLYKLYDLYVNYKSNYMNMNMKVIRNTKYHNIMLLKYIDNIFVN